MMRRRYVTLTQLFLPLMLQGAPSTQPQLSSSNSLINPNAQAILNGPVLPANCGGTNPCNSGVVTSINDGASTWTLGGTTNALSGCPISGTGYQVVQNGAAQASTSNVVGLLWLGGTLYHATCNLYSGSNHLQWNTWNGSTWVGPSTDPRLFCVMGSTELPVVCPNFYHANSIYNQQIPATSCTAGPGCYYPTGYTLTNAGITNTGFMNTDFAEGTAIYQATTTDPQVGIYYDPNFFNNSVSGSAPCSAQFAGGSTSAPLNNSQAADDCLRVGGSNSTNAVVPNYQAANNGMILYASAGNATTNSVAPAVAYRKQTNQSPVRVIYAPINAGADAGGDRRMMIIQPDGTAVDFVYVTKLSNSPGAGRTGVAGDYIAPGYSLFDLTSEMGDGFTNGIRASISPTSVGTITQSDVAAGVIDHAMSLLCGKEIVTVPPSTPFVVYPAYAHDNGNGSCPYNTCNALGTGIPRPMGAHYKLPQTAITGHTWSSASGPIMAAAFRDYGAFCLERGNTGVGLDIDSKITSATWTGGAPDTDLTYIVHNLQYMSNASCAGAGHATCPP